MKEMEPEEFSSASGDGSPMAEALENWQSKVNWEGDLLYVLENWPEMLPDDFCLKIQARALREAHRNFRNRFDKLCEAHKVDSL